MGKIYLLNTCTRTYIQTSSLVFTLTRTWSREHLYIKPLAGWSHEKALRLLSRGSGPPSWVWQGSPRPGFFQHQVFETHTDIMASVAEQKGHRNDKTLGCEDWETTPGYQARRRRWAPPDCAAPSAWARGPSDSYLLWEVHSQPQSCHHTWRQRAND